MNNLIRRAIYKHYKGGSYVLEAVGTMESTGEHVAIYYVATFGDPERWFVRPAKEFNDIVINAKGEKVQRFTRISFDEEEDMM